MHAHEPRPLQAKAMGLQRLRPVLEEARHAGRTVVFTNGVFDLLHPGHVSLLNRARRLGDLLIVGVNSDASTRRLKGPERPFVGQRDRALMVASLESVDYVVVFSEDTPLRLIRAVQPDVLVKGGDWTAGQIVGKDVVEARGGKIVRLKLLEGFSTTRIARRIKSRRQV